jgi:hypothetical protein
LYKEVVLLPTEVLLEDKRELQAEKVNSLLIPKREFFIPSIKM